MYKTNDKIYFTLFVALPLILSSQIFFCAFKVVIENVECVFRSTYTYIKSTLVVHLIEVF